MSWRPSTHPDRTCPECEQLFAPHDRRQVYCGKACRDAMATKIRAAKTETYVCEACEQTFERQTVNAESVTGLCRSCWRYGSRNPAWKGGGACFNSALGRWVVRHNGRLMTRARAVMSEALGRELDRREHVHHVNEDKTDDRLENLQVLDIREHAALHARNKRQGVAA